MRRTYPPPPGAASRVASEVFASLTRVHTDRELALTYFSQYRSKAELRDATKSSWRTLPAGDLLELTPEQLVLAEAYFDTLARFHLWLGVTEAMPATLEARYDLAERTLEAQAAVAIHALGGLPPEPPPPPRLPTWGTLDRPWVDDTAPSDGPLGDGSRGWWFVEE